MVKNCQRDLPGGAFRLAAGAWYLTVFKVNNQSTKAEGGSRLPRQSRPSIASSWSEE
jgi:hypothetical protein